MWIRRADITGFEHDDCRRNPDAGHTVLSSKSKELLRRWLNDDHRWYFRQWMKIGAFWHNKVPRKYRPAGVVHLALRGIVIASGPVIAVYYGSVQVAQAVVVGVGLIVLNIGTSVADRLSKQKSKSPDFATDGLVRVGDLISSYKANSFKPPQKDAAIEAFLGIIESIALPITNSQKGEISVALIQYVGTGTSKMTVKHRNPGNTRPKWRQFDTERVLGHHVCQQGDAPVTINDIAHLGSEFGKSPTQAKVDYKSILLIPIWCDTANGRQARGFVSIDCNHPYAFYGNRSNSITVMARPIIEQLRDVI